MTQSPPFDPYHEWLSIPPHEQPADHYRLLGVSRFESSANVISHAADRQMSHVRSFQTGPRAELSQVVLNQLSIARRCLLSPDSKAAYDTDLRLQIEICNAPVLSLSVDAPSMPAENPREFEPPQEVEFAISKPRKTRSPGKMASRVPMPLQVVGGGLAGCLLAALVLMGLNKLDALRSDAARSTAQVPAGDIVKKHSQSLRPEAAIPTNSRASSSATPVRSTQGAPGSGAPGTGAPTDSPAIPRREDEKVVATRISPKPPASSPSPSPSSTPSQASPMTGGATTVITALQGRSAPADAPIPKPTPAPPTAEPKPRSPDSFAELAQKGAQEAKQKADDDLAEFSGIRLKLQSDISVYRKDVESSIVTLQKAFDDVENKLRNTRNVRGPEQLQLIDRLKVESSAFEEAGFLPFSEPMRLFAANFVGRRRIADDNLRVALDRHIAAAVKAEDDALARVIVKFRDRQLAPWIVARWNLANWVMFSDFSIRGDFGVTNWETKGNTFVIRWRPPNAFVDTCTLSVVGDSFAGRNQYGARFGGGWLGPRPEDIAAYAKKRKLYQPLAADTPAKPPGDPR